MKEKRGREREREWMVTTRRTKESAQKIAHIFDKQIVLKEKYQREYYLACRQDRLGDSEIYWISLYKAIAEEMDLKPSVLMKAVKIAHKAKFQEEYDKFDELETILESIGKTL